MMRDAGCGMRDKTGKCQGASALHDASRGSGLHIKHEKSRFIVNNRNKIVFRIVPDFLRNRALSCFIVAKIRNPFLVGDYEQEETEDTESSRSANHNFRTRKAHRVTAHPAQSNQIQDE